MVSGDHHHNQHTTYLTFENTVEPGADKNTFPIAGIYYKDSPNVIRTILDTLYRRLSQLHKEEYLEFDFGSLPTVDNYSEQPLKSDKAARMVFDNLEYSDSEDSSDDEHLGYNIFEIPGKDMRTELVQRYKDQFTIYGPEGDVETDLGELVNLDKLKASTTAHECDICLRVFNNIENLFIHASFWHEDRQNQDISNEVTAETKAVTGIMKKTALYYALIGRDAEAISIGKETIKRQKLKLSAQRVEVKNIVKLEKKIKKRQAASSNSNIAELKTELRERKEKISKAVKMRFPQHFLQEPLGEEDWRRDNYFVSASCETCKQSTTFLSDVKRTSPRENYGHRRLKVRFVYTGDGKELNSCVGVVGSACFRCHVKNLWEWNTSRGKTHSMIRFPWETDDYEPSIRRERTTTEAAKNWKRYSEELKILITDFRQQKGTLPTVKQRSGLRLKARKCSQHQERPTILPDLDRHDYRVGEFHTAKNLGEKLYKRYVEVCKLLDLELTKNQFVTPFTKDSWEKHIAADDAQWSQTELMVSNGPYMSTFLEATKGLGISWSKISGGALTGDQAYAMFLYPELADLFKRITFTTISGKVFILIVNAANLKVRKKSYTC